MSDFLRFFNNLSRSFPMHMEIYYSRILDWKIKIWKEGCAKAFPDSEREGDDAILVNVQNSDMELCFAQAHVALKEWMLEHNDGY